LAGSLPDENACDPAQSLVMRETTDLRGLDDAVNGLKPRDREVIQARFGLAGGVTVTLGQLARRLNLACEGVRQIQSRALRRLRRQMRLQRLTVAITASRFHC
jgi:RNA polymerase nonessential primary-like sigma factor